MSGAMGIQKKRPVATRMIRPILTYFAAFGVFYNAHSVFQGTWTRQMLRSPNGADANGNHVQTQTKETATVISQQQQQQQQPRKPKLGDGCYHVFLDVGANRGMNSRFLMEPQLYPKAPVALGHFEREFGAVGVRDNRDICIFSFEPNPVHRERHLEIQKAYAQMGWRYHPFHAGVGAQDGEMQVPYAADPNHADWGFSTLGLANLQKGQATSQVTVPIKRFASFLLEEIEGRQIPQPHGVNATSPRAIMKMDIEGMELFVMPDLFMTGAMCRVVKMFYGEFHCGETGYFPAKHPDSKLLVAKDVNACYEYQKVMLNMINTNPHCPTHYKLGDDEHYLIDHQPLPTMNAQVQ